MSLEQDRARVGAPLQGAQENRLWISTGTTRRRACPNEEVIVDDSKRDIRNDGESPTIAMDVTGAIQHTLATRVAPRNTVLGKMEDVAKRFGTKAWAELKRHPYIGIGAAGVAGVAAASAIGVGELAIGAAVAYGVYNVLIRGVSSEEAVREVAHELERI